MPLLEKEHALNLKLMTLHKYGIFIAIKMNNPSPDMVNRVVQKLPTNTQERSYSDIYDTIQTT